MSRVLSHKAGLASTKLINSSVLIIFSIAPQTTNSSKLNKNYRTTATRQNNRIVPRREAVNIHARATDGRYGFFFESPHTAASDKNRAQVRTSR